MGAATAATSTVSSFGWVVNATNADWSGTEAIKAAPATTGQSHYINSIVLNSASAINFTIGAGETASAVTTVIVGPIYMAANTTLPQIVFHKPIKLAADTALVMDASGAGNATVIVEGYTE